MKPTSSRTSAVELRRPLRAFVDRATTHLAISLASITLCAGLAGCGFLKPAKPTARYFVLTPMAASAPAPGVSPSLAVGLGQVKIPAYLFNKSMALRKGTNEVEYLLSSLWAERLDTGIQRVLAANLATVLPSNQIRLSAWRTEDVSAEIYVGVQQFDVDTSGRGVLVAGWRITAPGGEKTLKAGETRLSRQGVPPDTDPSGAVVSQSELAAEFSRQLAQAVKDAIPGASK